MTAHLEPKVEQKRTTGAGCFGGIEGNSGHGKARQQATGTSCSGALCETSTRGKLVANHRSGGVCRAAFSQAQAVNRNEKGGLVQAPSFSIDAPKPVTESRIGSGHPGKPIL